MKIAVLVKPVPDTTLAKNIDSQTRRLVRTGAVIINPMDEFAVEAALRLQEAAPGSRVELVAMAPDAAKDALRKGLGMGADAAVHISDPALAGADAAVTVAVLAAALRKGEYDAVFCGIASSDGAGYYVPRMLAAKLGRAFIGDALQVGVDGAMLTAVQQCEGQKRSVRAPLPVVITITKEIGAVRYPSLKGIMAAKSKPLTVVTVADLGLEPAALLSKMSVQDVVMRPARQAAIIKTPADPEAAAQEIRAFMRARGAY